jgi:hypothetical protein
MMKISAPCLVLLSLISATLLLAPCSFTQYQDGRGLKIVATFPRKGVQRSEKLLAKPSGVPDSYVPSFVDRISFKVYKGDELIAEDFKQKAESFDDDLLNELSLELPYDEELRFEISSFTCPKSIFADCVQESDWVKTHSYTTTAQIGSDFTGDLVLTAPLDIIEQELPPAPDQVPEAGMSNYCIAFDEKGDLYKVDYKTAHLIVAVFNPHGIAVSDQEIAELVTDTPLTCGFFKGDFLTTYIKASGEVMLAGVDQLDEIIAPKEIPKPEGIDISENFQVAIATGQDFAYVAWTHDDPLNARCPHQSCALSIDVFTDRENITPGQRIHNNEKVTLALARILDDDKILLLLKNNDANRLLGQIFDSTFANRQDVGNSDIDISSWLNFQLTKFDDPTYPYLLIWEDGSTNNINRAFFGNNGLEPASVVSLVPEGNVATNSNSTNWGNDQTIVVWNSASGPLSNMIYYSKLNSSGLANDPHPIIETASISSFSPKIIISDDGLAYIFYLSSADNQLYFKRYLFAF